MADFSFEELSTVGQQPLTDLQRTAQKDRKLSTRDARLVGTGDVGPEARAADAAQDISLGNIDELEREIANTPKGSSTYNILVQEHNRIKKAAKKSLRRDNGGGGGDDDSINPMASGGASVMARNSSAPQELSFEELSKVGSQMVPSGEKPKPGLIDYGIAYAKGLGGEVASIADIVLGLPGMALSLASNIHTTARALAEGEDGKLAFAAGRAASEGMAEHPYNIAANPVYKVMNLIKQPELYEGSTTTAMMQKLTSAIQRGGDWLEVKTGGVVTAEAFETFVDAMMVGLAAKGGDATIKAVRERAARTAEQKKTALDDSRRQETEAAPLPVEDGPRASAQEQINQMLNIKKIPEREAYNARRRKEVRDAFKKDPDYADYLKFLANERVERHDAFNAEVARQAMNDAKLEEMAKANPEIDFRNLDTDAALKIMQKSGMERTAEDLLDLAAWNRQGRPDVKPRLKGPPGVIEEGMPQIGSAEAGVKSALPKAAAASLAVGSAADYVLNPEHREAYEKSLPALGAILAVKQKGGMWHPEAVERLNTPLKESLVRGTPMTEEGLKAQAPVLDWSRKAIRNYLNKYAGTEGDPLKDVEIPARYGTETWGKMMDESVRPFPATEIDSHPNAAGQLAYDIRDSASASAPIRNYLSHAGDYAREHISPEKLQQYDLVRLIKETAKWDAELAKKMNSVEGRLEGTTPYKKYPDGFQWVEVGKVDESAPLPKEYTIKEKDGKFWIAKDGKIMERREQIRDGAISAGPGDFKTREEALYAAHRLVGDEALKREGDVMGHCVGGYCDYVESGEVRIFSLRDKKGMSHVTVEVQPGMKAAVHHQTKEIVPQAPDDIVQIKGKQNRAPAKEYLPYVQDFVRGGKWGDVGDLGNSGLTTVKDALNLFSREKDFSKQIAERFGNEKYVDKAELDKMWENTNKDTLSEHAGKSSERGFVEAKLLARMAAVGIGMTAGIALDPSNKIEGAILGALGGLVAGSVSPKGVASVVKNAWKADSRIRINDLANAHETATARASRAVWQLQTKIEELVPNPDNRIKITHWLEGDKTIVLNPAEIKAANIARQYYDAMRDVGQEAGVLKSALDNYVTHLWEFGTQTRSTLEEVFGKRRGQNMSPESKFALRRSVPTIAEGKELGLTPRTEDISSIIGIYGNAISRSMANKQMLTSLKGGEVPGTDGAKLVMPSSKAPPFYVSVDHPQLSGMRVHPDIAPSLRFIYDNSNPGVVMAGLEGLNMVTKRMAVSFSLFHAKALADAAIGASNNPLVVGKYIAQAAFPKLFGENFYLKQLREGGAGDLVDKAQQAGLKFSYERGKLADEDVNGTFYRSMKDLQSGLDSMLPGLGLPVKAFTKINHMSDTFMWERLHAGMKLSVFAEKLASLTENNAKARLRDPSIPVRSPEQLGEMAASFTNDIFGGLNWRRVAEETKTKWGRDAALAAYSPTGRRFLQLLLFAPDWTLSTTRAMTKAFGSLLGHEEGTGVRGLFEAKTSTDLHRQYLVRSAIYYAAVGDAINYSLSGHHLWENKDWTTIDLGDGRRMQWSKHTMEPIHWITKPGQQGLNKLGFVPREMMNQLLGTQYLSTSGHAPKMDTSMGGRLAHAARQFSPISVQQSFEAGPSSGIAGFFGVPIYGYTEKQKQENRELRRLKRAMEGVRERKQ